MSEKPATQINLNDALSANLPNQRRAYYPPLAAIPPAQGVSLDWSATQSVFPNQYDGFTERRPRDMRGGLPVDTSVDLDIYVKSPPNASMENGLPPPAIRLHAVDGGSPHRIWLRMMSFGKSSDLR